MSGDDIPTPTLISQLANTENIYQGTDAAGRLLFRQNVYDNMVAKERCVTGASLVALALTEVCCRIGRGKVRKGRKARGLANPRG